MPSKIRSFIQSYHPIVHVMVLGTVLARTASTMSLPFLAIYLHATTELNPGMIGLIVGAGPLAGTIGGFFGGALSDRFGRRKIMLAASFGWSIVFLGFALAKDPVTFLILNMVNGLCRSFYEPVSQALMADMTDKEKRLKVFSLRYFAINVGAAIGPILGGVLGTGNSPLPFIITGIVYLVYSVLLYVLLNVFGIRQIEGERKERASITAAFHAVRKDITLRYYIIGGIIGAIGYSQMTSTLSQYLGGNFEDGVRMFTILMSLNAIVVILLQMPLTRWAEKHSALTLIILGNILFAAGLIGFGISSVEWAFYLSMVVFTLGEIFNFPASALLMDRIAPEHMRGAYFGAQSFNSLGFSFGPWVGGALLSGFSGFSFVLVAAITLCGSYFYRKGDHIFETAIKKTSLMPKQEEAKL